MPKILLGVSIALILASAVLGFLTKGKIEIVKQDLKQTSETLATTKGSLAKTQKELTANQEELKQTNEKLTQTSGELATAKADIQKAKEQATDLQGKLTAAEDTIKKLQSPSTQPGDEQVSPVIVELQTKVKDLEIKLTEKEQLVASLTQKQQEAESRAKVLAEKEDRRQRQFMAKGLEGQVLAVNQAWNFVVLNIGDRQGVIVGAQMIVKRGGQMIGKVKITAVEPTTAIADVVLESVPRGAHVVPGDNVVYVGS